MKKGFTLVEIMIVVVIITSLAALVIFNLLRTRLNTNEAIAIASLRLISSAAQAYKAVHPTFPSDLNILGSVTPPYIDSILGCSDPVCLKRGYYFNLTGSTNTFIAIAYPQSYGITGRRSFCVDESGIIRYTDPNSAVTSTAGCNSTFGDVLE